MKIPLNKLSKLKISSRSLIITCVFASYIFVFSEWLFLVTKPSFMSVLSIFEKVKVFLGFGSLFAIAVLLVITPVLLLDALPILKANRHYLNLFGALLPASILTCLLLLLIDNFTYTLLSFGVYTSHGLIRVIYLLAFLFFVIIFWGECIKFAYKITNWLNELPNRKQKVILFSFLFLLIIPLIFIFSENAFKRNFDQRNTVLGNKFSAEYHIDHDRRALMQAICRYSGMKEIQPLFLKKLPEVSLIAENNFTNSLKTAGSITSMLTGKYPTTTRVLFPPDILRSDDSYQHLPGILRNAGYYAAQFGHRYFVDAYQVNMLNGFDEVNDRSFQENPVFSQFSSVLPANYAFFAYEVGNRLVDRLRHIFFIKDMQNPFEQVTANEPQNFHDAEKIQSTLNLLDRLNQPLFVHIHWMGTHGARFSPKEQVFSAGKDLTNQEVWDRDFYDDAILEFDQAIAGLMDELVLRKMDKNTSNNCHKRSWAGVDR